MNQESETKAMDERLRALIDQIPEKPPRSKLEPHVEVIRELRRKGRTYQEIARFFGEHLNITVAASTIHAFVEVRARRRKRRIPIELPAMEPEMENAKAEANAGVAASAEADVRGRIEAIKRRPPPEKAAKPKFEYNESEPLQLAPGPNQEG
jgi:hypothetical protein